MTQNLGDLGMGLMFVLAVIGVCYGIKLILGAKRSATEEIKPETESQIIVLMGMITTKVLYAFLIFLLHHEKAVESPDIWFTSTLVCGVAFCFSTVIQGSICADGVKKILQGKGDLNRIMVYAAFPEFMAVLALVYTFMLQS